MQRLGRMKWQRDRQNGLFYGKIYRKLIVLVVKTRGFPRYFPNKTNSGIVKRDSPCGSPNLPMWTFRTMTYARCERAKQSRSGSGSGSHAKRVTSGQRVAPLATDTRRSRDIGKVNLAHPPQIGGTASSGWLALYTKPSFRQKCLHFSSGQETSGSAKKMESGQADDEVVCISNHAHRSRVFLHMFVVRDLRSTLKSTCVCALPP